MYGLALDEKGEVLGIVMELMPGGSLCDALIRLSEQYGDNVVQV
jgi:hypothetical protein